MDAPLSAPDALIRPWRTATLVASLVAAIELVLLLVAAVLLLAKPLSHAMQRQAQAAAFKTPAHAKPTVKPVHRVRQVPAQGEAAALEDERVGAERQRPERRCRRRGGETERVGYRIGGTANAARTDYATTVVMYRPGFRGEGLRLARDLRLKVVGPLDGLKPAALHGAQLVVLLGAV